jgi:tetratricopeptide (TPR) repeat protein
MGVAFKGKGDLQGAIANYRRGLKLMPNDTTLHSALGDALWNVSDWDGALASYRRALELDPENAYSHNSAAWRFANRTDADGKFLQAEQAVEWARKATELEPDQPAYQNTFGLALYRAGQWREASEALLKSISLGEDGPYNWLFLAMAYWQLDQKDKAQEWYDKSLAWKAGHAEELTQDSELRGFFDEATSLLAKSANPGSTFDATRATPDQPREALEAMDGKDNLNE